MCVGGVSRREAGRRGRRGGGGLSRSEGGEDSSAHSNGRGSSSDSSASSDRRGNSSRRGRDRGRGGEVSRSEGGGGVPRSVAEGEVVFEDVELSWYDERDAVDGGVEEEKKGRGGRGGEDRREEERKNMRVGEEEGERGPVLRVEGRIYIAPKSLNLVFGRVRSGLTKAH
jgi:hypothetical protein